MGNISLSHCKDAIAIAWNRERIGIDIERKDRIFNYEKLAKKYFNKINKGDNQNIYNKNMILKQWSAIEAAVKWENGKLAKDLKNWHYCTQNKELFHP